MAHPELRIGMKPQKGGLPDAHALSKARIAAHALREARAVTDSGDSDPALVRGAQVLQAQILAETGTVIENWRVSRQVKK